MAEFILGNALRAPARKYRWLRLTLWWLDYVLIFSLVAVFRLLPVDTASRLGYRVGRWVGPLMKKKTAVYRENLATALPDRSEEDIDALVVEAWGSAGRILAEYVHLEKIMNDPEGERLQIEVVEPFITLTEPEKPVVIVTAHQSNWELVCSAMARLNMPNSSLYSPPTNPWLDRLLLDSRRALNCELLPRDKSARLLMQAIRKGRTAAMVMDRRIDDGHPVSFFGKDKPSTILPAKLALKYNCPMIPVKVQRIRDAYFKVTFLPPVSPRNPTESETSQAIDMTEQVHAIFEDWIRAAPQDWFCSKRIWPKPGREIKRKPPGKNETKVDSYAA